MNNIPQQNCNKIFRKNFLNIVVSAIIVALNLGALLIRCSSIGFICYCAIQELDFCGGKEREKKNWLNIMVKFCKYLEIIRNDKIYLEAMHLFRASHAIKKYEL